jgi:uncharacterized protein (TIGR02145 family)/prepilin-type N-terminal cleavage/methylation domain-containing protein
MLMLKMNKQGFTIVELLVVIVVIGILATITIVSYSGVTQKATETSLKSDLLSAQAELTLFQLNNGAYPTSISDCPNPASGNMCLKASAGTSFTAVPYVVDNSSNPQSFTLTATNGDISYRISDEGYPVAYVSLAVSDPANWIQVGTQVWAKYNLNVGTRINSTSSQNNNAVIEKYCYDNLESNCIAHGALYQWNEAMQYSTTEGAKGICPTGSHIPSDNDWKILEMHLGMSQAQVDSTGWRGTDQGTKLMLGGISGLDIPLSGYFNSYDSTFYGLQENALLWTSSKYSSYDISWTRILSSSETTRSRDTWDKVHGLAIRCIGN